MEGGKGGNSYWPGFVDALTNVVIAMIFVIVVLAIALSFAAQLMGKKLAEQYIAAAAASAAAAAPAKPAPAAAPAEVLPVPESRRSGRTRIAVSGGEAASSPNPARVGAVRNVLQLDFAPNATTLDPAAAEQLKVALAPVERRQRAVVIANGPDMQLSFNQRSAYLRVMAVRNVLIEQGFPPGKVSVRIDTQSTMKSATVNVSFQEGP
jgi:outer membrane protein OmpA-like peptidoglycan-associated protein